MEGNYCVGWAIKGSNGSSSYKHITESISEAFRGKNIMQTLIHDLCYTGREREEGLVVLHLHRTCLHGSRV